MKLTQSGISIAKETFHFTLHEISLQNPSPALGPSGLALSIPTFYSMVPPMTARMITATPQYPAGRITCQSRSVNLRQEGLAQM